MTLTIALTSHHINTLDLSPVQNSIEPLLQNGAIASHEQSFNFDIDYPLDPTDPRELSEVPEIRLWFVRLDSVYPWIAFLLDWKSGELVRYVAMLVPHQFSRSEGIQYNPEALEILVMQKTFVLADWLQKQGITPNARLKSMAQLFGYELDDSLFELLT